MYEHDMQAMDTSDWVWMTPTVLSWIIPTVIAVVVGVLVRGEALAVTSRWRRMGRFLCHASGMTVAMMLGMVVLATTFTWYEQTELAVFAMALGMSAPMLALMRYHGESWKRCSEMAAAMLSPAVALLALFWLGVLAGHLVVPAQMLLMLPAMTVVMLYRADQYAGQECTMRPARG
jgi:hypothetical protein